MGTEYVVISTPEPTIVVSEGARGIQGYSWNSKLRSVQVITNTHNILEDEDYIGVNYSGPVSLILNTIDTKTVIIKDESGLASQNNITISPSTGLIEGEISITIPVNWMSLTLVCNSGNWFIV